MTQDEIKRLLSDSTFKQLASERSKLRWSLSLLVLVMFFGFIALISAARGALGVPIAGSEIPLGLALALAMIVFVVLLTAFYVQRSNARFDPLTRELNREFQR
jgi:uncharacterized membrane protein (DUF485 family)